MYSESDLLPLSALQHLMFCERQCALIHSEQLWDENVLTIEGRHLHDKVDSQPPVESREDTRIARGLPLRSLRLGLSGKADVVEFHSSASGITLKGVSGLWTPYPVEYKRGRPKRNKCDEVQLCAQALCLEEMLNASIPKGALYYGKTRHRMEVSLGPDLRRTTEETAARLHRLISSGVTPKAAREPKCDNCSLLSLCLPGNSGRRRSAASYLASVFSASDPGANAEGRAL